MSCPHIQSSNNLVIMIMKLILQFKQDDLIDNSGGYILYWISSDIFNSLFNVQMTLACYMFVSVNLENLKLPCHFSWTCTYKVWLLNNVTNALIQFKENFHFNYFSFYIVPICNNIPLYFDLRMIKAVQKVFFSMLSQKLYFPIHF